MKEAKEEYDKKISEYSGSMERLRNELADLSKRKRSLMEIRDEKKLMLKMDEIMADQNRYKKSELKNDDLFAEKKYGCWLVNNDKQ